MNSSVTRLLFALNDLISSKLSGVGSGYEQFVTRTVRYGQFVTGQFVTGHFVTWTLRYMDSSLHGYFNMKSLRKQTIF